MTPIHKAFDLGLVEKGETIYVALDVSGGSTFMSVKAQLSDIARACEAFEVKRVIICTFTSAVEEMFDITGNFHVLDRISQLGAGGGTNIAAPLLFIRDYGGRQEDAPVRKVFVFTDGFFDHRDMAGFDLDLAFIISGDNDRSMETMLGRYGDTIHA